MTDIQFSPQQDAALKLIGEWYKSGTRDPFVLNGYAGTGKTTIAKFLPEMIGAQEKSEVIYTAYTGKAALQLRRKGCEKATTLHKLLYKPLEKDRTRVKELAEALHAALVNDPLAEALETRTIKHQLLNERRKVAAPSWSTNPDWDRIEAAKMIVVDESSMVDEKIAKDLKELGLPIIYCGDPFQLPPVRGKSPVSELPVSITLTEVHRQALENPILRAATHLRNGMKEHVFTSLPQEGDMLYKVLTTRQAGYDDYASVDQVLCGRNKTRQGLNSKMQAKKLAAGQLSASTEQGICEGERVVFLRNDYDEDVFNGTIGVVDSVLPGEKDSDHVIISGSVEDDTFEAYETWAGVLRGQEISEAPRFMQVIDLAYALTVHKAQGSEWDSVLVHFEPLGRAGEWERWFYTALTRARTRCTVVIPNDMGG